MREYSIQELALMSTNSARSIPKSHKLRPLRQDIMNAANLPATDKQAWERMKQEYHGRRKPALVTRWIWNGKTHRVSLGPVRIYIRLTAEGNGKNIPPEWTAFLQFNNQAGRRRFLSARDTTPAKAARKLFEMPRWFFDGVQWQALTWVYKSIVMYGLSDATEPQGDYEVGLKSGTNLHVPGIWLWNNDVLMDVKPRTVLAIPDRKDMVSDRVYPDSRSSEGYIQDDMIGKPRYGKKFYDRHGNPVTGIGKVVKAPRATKFTNKDPNPNRVIPSNTFEGFKPLREWDHESGI